MTPHEQAMVAAWLGLKVVLLQADEDYVGGAPHTLSLDPDTRVRALVGEKPNLLVPHILIASYLYYVLDQSVISDALFDAMCTRLLAEWSTIEHHHKHLITPEDLRAGTGFAFQYPERVVSAALHFRDQFLGQSVRPVARRRSKKKT